MTTCCDQNAPPGGCRQGRACPVRLAKTDTVDLGGGNVYFPDDADKLSARPGSAEDVALCWLGRVLILIWFGGMVGMVWLLAMGLGALHDTFGSRVWGWLAGVS